MTRDNTHSEFIERWAEFVRTHDRTIWKREQNRFIDAQIIIARDFFERLKGKPEGKDILHRIKEAKLEKHGEI